MSYYKRQRAREKARRARMVPFSRGTKTTPTQVMYNRKWMVWAGVIILVVILFWGGVV